MDTTRPFPFFHSFLPRLRELASRNLPLLHSIPILSCLRLVFATLNPYLSRVLLIQSIALSCERTHYTLRGGTESLWDWALEKWFNWCPTRWYTALYKRALSLFENFTLMSTIQLEVG